MDPESHDDAIDVDRLLLVVVGAHLRAEATDRPLAYRLREQILRWQDDRLHETDDQLEPMLCTDLWYLNNDDLRLQPTIAIGGAGVNAATAFYAMRLPSAFVIDKVLEIQMELDAAEPKAVIWGTDARATASAVDTFAERYLDEFMRACHGLPATD
jgi:hypothetical protein